MVSSRAITSAPPLLPTPSFEPVSGRRATALAARLSSRRRRTSLDGEPIRETGQDFRPQFLQAPSLWLFVNANGDPWTVNELEEVVKRSGVATGSPRLACHLLRHTFATNYLVRKVGAPLRLQQILRHTSLEMVRHDLGRSSCGGW